MKKLIFILSVLIIFFSCKKEVQEKVEQKKEVSEIVKLNDLNVDYGKSPNLPTQIEIKLTDGSSKFLYIQWDSIVNTTIVGSHLCSGKIIADNEVAEIKDSLISIKVNVNDKNSKYVSDKWFKNYLYDGFTNDGMIIGSAIVTDSMNCYEKDINSLDYYYRIITDNATNKYIHDYLLNNYNVNISEITLDSRTVAILFMYTFHYKTIIADTLKPIIYTKTANDYILHNQINAFASSYGEKYLTEGTLIGAYGSYMVVQFKDNQSSISKDQINSLYKKFDLKSNDAINFNDFNNKYFAAFSLGGLMRGLLGKYGFDAFNDTPMSIRYKDIQMEINESISDTSLFANNNLYLIRTKYNRYIFNK